MKNIKTKLKNYTKILWNKKQKGGESMRLRFKFFAVLLSLVLVSSSAFGAGFQLIEQSVSGLGNAFAGGAASAEDATTIFFNPAGMTRLNSQFIAGLHFISPSAKFKNDGSNFSAPPYTTSTLLSGGNGGDAGVNALVPNLYYLHKLSDKMALGLGVNVPFGLATEYSKDWVGRYHAIRSDVKTININPSFAYKVANGFSIGGGVNIQQVKAELTKAVFTGTPVDGFAKLEGDSWGMGFNLGILFEPTNDTRIGLSYRSQVNHKLEGDLNITLPTGPLPKVDVTADLTLPEMMSFSVYHKLTPKLALMADVSATGWNQFRELKVIDKNTGAIKDLTPENWRSTIKSSLGASYYMDDKNTLRFGVAYDKNPVPDPEHRTPRIPDGDRTWIAAGYGYKVSKNFSFDLGAAYLFVLNDPKINNTTYLTTTGVKGTIKGTYENNVKILSAQINYNF